MIDWEEVSVDFLTKWKNFCRILGESSFDFGMQKAQLGISADFLQNCVE
jgi:hypothetical protein